MIIRGLKIAARQLVYLSIILAVILTLLVATVYWLSNAVEERQDEIATWVGERLGYPVTIGSANLDWIDFKPKLQIGDLTLFSEDHKNELVALGQLYVGLDLIKSVQRGQPVLNDITLHDLKIAVLRDYSGQIQIQDLNIPIASSEHDLDWQSWIVLLNRFQLENIKVIYTDQLNKFLSGQYELVNGAISHHNEQWTTVGRLKPPSAVAETIVFTAQADIKNDLSDIHSWRGQAKVTKLKFEPISDDSVWQDVKVKQGNITGQFSASGVGNKIDIITTNIESLQAKFLSTINDLPAVDLEASQGKIDWKQGKESWKLSGKMALSINDDAWPEMAFFATKDPQGDTQITAKYLRLSDIVSLLSLSNITPDIIRKQQAFGDIEELDLHFSDNGITELSFNLKEGGILAWQDYPGITNLTAQINWLNGVSHIQVDSHNLTLYAKPWLDDALFFDSITGELQLDYEQERWQLTSKGLHIWNDDLTVQMEGEVNREMDGKIINDLTITLGDIAVNQWKKYVPRKGFHPHFKKWSDDAFIAGKITEGEIILKGDLAAFPYEKEPDKGQFKMALKAENVQLHYAPGWPDLTDLTGTITGSGNDLIIKTKQGKTAGFDFMDVTTTITKLTEHKPLLRVEGEVKGTTAKALQFLKDSPLKKRFGIIADEASAKGLSHINLDLTVPLTNVEKTKVAGYVSFKDSQLHYKASPEIGMTHVNGRLYFSEKGVKAKNIRATAFNEPVTINVQPDGEKAIVSVLSHIDTKQINTIWPGKLPDYITGRTPYEMELTVVEKELGKFYLDVDLNSDLSGLTLAMPAPLGKEEKQKIPFKVTMQNVDNNLVYTAQYGDVLNAIAKPKEDLWQGEIRFGKGKANLPNNGIKIAGQLAELSVDDWLEWTKQQHASDDTLLIKSIDDVSVSLGKLTGFDQSITNLNLASQKDANGWRTNIDSKQMRGFIYLPTDLKGSSTIKVDLDHLTITLPKKSEAATSARKEQPVALWPSVELSINTLELDGKPLGSVRLQAKKSENQWTINTGQLTSDVFTLSVVEGVWNKAAAKDNTQLKLHLESNDLDLLLSKFGYQKAIDAEKVIVKANVSWPSDPLDFELNSLYGTLNMNIGKGTLQDIEPGAAGRIFGLMSIAALPRRLSLDFSDLFGKGFTFDSITGDFKLENGLAITDNFIVKSASAEIEIIGDTDLVNQHYDQQVKITPNVSSTLPLAGAVAGGSVGLGVGAAILLVDKLTDKLFDKNIVNIISYKYDLTGPWDDPLLSISSPPKQENTANSQRKVLKK